VVAFSSVRQRSAAFSSVQQRSKLLELMNSENSEIGIKPVESFARLALDRGPFAFLQLLPW
jgi:hypothetical protein